MTKPSRRSFLQSTGSGVAVGLGLAGSTATSLAADRPPQSPGWAAYAVIFAPKHATW